MVALVGQRPICLFIDFVFTRHGDGNVQFVHRFRYHGCATFNLFIGAICLSISFSRGDCFGWITPIESICLSVQFVYLSISFSRGAVVALVRQRSLFRRLGNVQFVYRFRFHAMSAIRLVIDFVTRSRYLNQTQIPAPDPDVCTRSRCLHQIQTPEPDLDTCTRSRYLNQTQIPEPDRNTWTRSSYLNQIQIPEPDPDT